MLFQLDQVIAPQIFYTTSSMAGVTCLLIFPLWPLSTMATSGCSPCPTRQPMEVRSKIRESSVPLYVCPLEHWSTTFKFHFPG